MAERGNSPRTGHGWVGVPIPDEGDEGYIPRSPNVTGPRASGSDGITAVQVSAQPGEVDQYAVPEAAQHRAQGQRPDRHRIPGHPRRSSGDHRHDFGDGLRFDDRGSDQPADLQGHWRRGLIGQLTRRDSGQAFPIYITVVAGLLFLALAYFAVGQAAANRNDAQSAADAAALAAAHDARVQIGEELVDEDLDLDNLVDLIAGRLFQTAQACSEAQQFAGKNNANSESCSRVPLPQQGFQVDVKTRESVGSSVIPGTEERQSTASATAVVEPRCTLTSTPEEGEILEVTCKGEDLEIDLEDDDPLPSLDQLFTVRLTN